MSAPNPTHPILSAIQGIPIIGLPSLLNNTLQYDQPTNTFIWVAEVVQSMGDLEFLRDKQLTGDLTHSTGFDSSVAPSTIASIIPAVGKTFFLAGSSVLIELNAANAQITQTLQNDGTTVEDYTTVLNTDGVVFCKGTVKGDSLVGDGVKIYRIQKTAGPTNSNTSGTINGWIQDT